MTTRGMLLALVCLCLVTVFGYWRYKTREDIRGVAQIAIIRDTSDSTQNDCSRIVGLTERALGVPEVGAGSRIALFAFGNEETANEPRLLGDFKVPVIRRVIEGQRAAARERRNLLTQLRERCAEVGQTQVSPIFQALKRGVEHLRSIGTPDDARYLFIQTDGEETANLQIRRALGASDVKLNLPTPIQNAGVRVTFCGMAETVGTSVGPNNKVRYPSKQRDAQRPDRLREVWSQVFTEPQLVSFEPFCSKGDFAGGTSLSQEGATGAPDESAPLPEAAAGGSAEVAKEAEVEATREAEAIRNAIAEKPAELQPSLHKYAESSEDIKSILGQGLEAKNIGGAVAVAVTNLQKNGGRGIDPPDQLGFRRIDYDKALISRALKGEVDILKVTVSSVGKHLFEVVVEVRNNTGFPLECVVPKGQLVEIRNARNGPGTQIVNAAHGPIGLPQTIASAGEEKGSGGETVVPPWEPSKIKFIAYCANPSLPKPEGSANLAIYALEDTSYETWSELRELRRRKLNLPVGADWELA